MVLSLKKSGYIDATMQTAKAICVATFGGPEVLRVCNVPIPSTGAGQVLLFLL